MVYNAIIYPLKAHLVNDFFNQTMTSANAGNVRITERGDNTVGMCNEREK